MLVLNVKNKFYNMIINGDKTEEFREVKPYWDKRFKNIKKGDEVKIMRGYTGEYIKVIIKDLKLITFNQLPLHAKNFFNNEDFIYYVLSFKKE